MARKKTKTPKKTKTQKSVKATTTASLAQALSSTSSSGGNGEVSAFMAPQMTAQQLVMTAVLWLVAHSAVIFLANRWFPQVVVLGTNVITPTMGLVYSMVVFTLITVGAIPVIEAVSAQMRMRLSNLHWFALFLVIDTAAIWLVARFAEQLGLGISWWGVAVVIGLLMDLIQGFLVKVANPK